MIVLSILTPALPKRLAALEALCAKLNDQIGDQPAEHLVLLDNKRRTVGDKRDALLRIARGQYVAFVDDDDDVAPDYVDSLFTAAQQNPDVITFLQRVEYNGLVGTCHFGLGNPNEPFQEGDFKRNAWHICAWRRLLAIQSQFPSSNYGEDAVWAAPLWRVQGLKSVHLDKVLHTYRHTEATTEAPPPV